MRTVAEHKQQYCAVRCVNQEAHFFEGEFKSVIEYLRNRSINCNCDVDKPKRKFNCSLKPLYNNEHKKMPRYTYL